MRRPDLTTFSETVKAQLRRQTQQSPQAALLHRLHCVALACAGFGSAEIAAAFGDDRRSVQRWVRRFQADGVEGLDNRSPSGRPAGLGAPELRELRLALQEAPRRLGHASGGDWDAETMQLEIRRRFGIAYSRRHCARLLGALRREEAGADSEDAAGLLAIGASSET